MRVRGRRVPPLCPPHGPDRALADPLVLSRCGALRSSHSGSCSDAKPDATAGFQQPYAMPASCASPHSVLGTRTPGL